MTSSQNRKWRESLEAYAYLAPAGIVLAVFWFFPVVLSFAMSFGNVTALMPLSEMRFVGLQQYQAALSSEAFVDSLWNTTNYALYYVPATLLLSLGAALLLNTSIAGRGFFRTVIFLPHITTWVAISLVFSYLFHREYGLGNWFLRIIMVDILGYSTFTPLDWLAEPRGIWSMLLHGGKTNMVGPLPLGLDHLINGPSLSLACIIFTSVWRDIGYFMIIFLAGLQNIDKSLYEASSIDGANGWRRFLHITFPLLSPVTFFLLVISMIQSFKVFVPQYMMTPLGGPGGTTQPVVMLLYKEGFSGEWKLSYASAIAYLLTLIILSLTLLQNRLFANRVEYGH